MDQLRRQWKQNNLKQHSKCWRQTCIKQKNEVGIEKKTPINKLIANAFDENMNKYIEKRAL